MCTESVESICTVPNARLALDGQSHANVSNMNDDRKNDSCSTWSLQSHRFHQVLMVDLDFRCFFLVKRTFPAAGARGGGRISTTFTSTSPPMLQKRQTSTAPDGSGLDSTIHSAFELGAEHRQDQKLVQPEFTIPQSTPFGGQ